MSATITTTAILGMTGLIAAFHIIMWGVYRAATLPTPLSGNHA